tara:strand:- start:278 stop:937 length:660 start_codon:yes stop_codon:yes gene_type:complete
MKIGLRFGHGMGSHGMASVFALHPKILHIHLPQAKKKLRGKHDKLNSLGTSLMPFVQTMMYSAHVEYIASDVIKSEELREQKDYHVVGIAGIDNTEYSADQYDLHVRAVNLEWLKTKRKKTSMESLPIVPGVHTIDFKMDAVIDKADFEWEVRKVTTYLGLEDIDPELLDIVRRIWVLNVETTNKRIAHKESLTIGKGLLSQDFFKSDEFKYKESDFKK